MKKAKQSNSIVLKHLWELKEPNQIRANFNTELYLKILKHKLNECK
jgi:hypothetical protein